MSGAVEDAVPRAERECLGAALAGEAGALETVLGELGPEDYYRPAHASVHRAMLELMAAGEPVTVATVAARLVATAAIGRAGGADRVMLDAIGGPGYLRELVDTRVAPGDVAHHVTVVEAAGRRRRAGECLARAAQLTADPVADPGRAEAEIRSALEYLSWRSGNRWPTPRPLNSQLPEFPVHALPGVLRRVVTAVAAATQTPPDLAALAALAAESVVVRGNYEIRVGGGGWTEQACLYLMALSDSGTRKSAVLDAVAAPVTELAWDDADAELHAIEAAAYEVLEKRYRSATDRAAKAPRGAEYDDALREAEDLRVQLAGKNAPAELRMLCDDTTPEELAVLMAGQGGPMGVLSDEGGLIGTLAGRYSKAGSAANIDVVLRAFNGTPVRVDRVGRPPVKIRRPILTLGFVIQPDVLDEAVKIPELTGRGLLPRFLFAKPATTVGTRGLDPPSVPAEVSAEWAATIGKIYSAGQDARRVAGGRPGVILLDAAAKAALDAWRGLGGHESRLHPDTGDLADMAAWASKLPGALVRVAAMFALAERPGDAHPRVHEAEMRAALALAPYLIAHARESLGRTGRIEHLEAVLAWVKKMIKDIPSNEINSPGKKFIAPAGAQGLTFTLRDAWQGVRGQVWAKRTEDVAEALARLADLGYVRTLPPSPPKRGRPPSPGYEVNPKLGRLRAPGGAE